MEELDEAGDPKACGEEVGDGGGAEKVAAGLPVEVAVHKDVVKGEATSAMGARGIVARSGTEMV